MLRKRTLVLLALAMSLGVWQFTIRARGAAPASSLASPILTGTIRAISGEPLEGVAVSARLMDKTITTTVYTDEQGRYVFSPLASGHYRMWTNAVGFETSRAELNLDAARANTQAFTLKPMADFSKQLNSTEWFAALPVNTVEDRRMKEVLYNNCAECHQLNFALQNRFDEAGWRSIVNLMERIGYYGDLSAPVDMAEGKFGGAYGVTINHHKEELVAYLTKIRGPNSPPLNFKPLPRPKGDAARVVITEYDIPLAERPDEWHVMDGSDWSEGVPQMQQNAIHDAYADHFGNVWLTVGYQNRNVSMYKLDPKTGQVTGYNLPAKDGKFARNNHGLTRDQKGFIWTDQQDETKSGFKGLLRIEPKTEQMTIFYPPRRMGSGTSTSVDWDAKGKIWTATRYGSIAFDPATQKFSYFQNVSTGSGGTYGAAGDFDGNGWWTQQSEDIVNKADYKTGKTHEIRIPPRREVLELFPAAEREWYDSVGALAWGGFSSTAWAEYTRRVGGDKTAPYAYVPLWWGSSLAKIDARTLQVTYHQLPFKGAPYFAVVDKNSNAWTNVASDDRVAKFDPKTGQYTIYNLPSRGTVTRNTNVDDYQKDPEVWQAYWGTNRVARLQFRTEAELKAVK